LNFLKKLDWTISSRISRSSTNTLASALLLSLA
jgi:hypothetical protein